MGRAGPGGGERSTGERRAAGPVSSGATSADEISSCAANEAAAKVIIKRVIRRATRTNQLVPELKRLDILAGRLGNLLTPLAQVFQNAGGLRNAPGTGHGSIDLTSPEANTVLLGLHHSGSILVFLAQRWKSMKPRP